MSFSDFARRMRRRARQVETGVDRIVKETAILCDQTLVLATPVDTGRARANWQVSIGQPETEPIPDEDKSGGTTIAAGRATIEGRPPGQDIFISNNLPYIGRLNEGWSAQAPAGFVEEAVQVAVDYARNRARVFDRGN